MEDRKRLVQRLTDALKQYFPLIPKLFAKRLASDLVIELLQRWPSLAQLKRPHPKTLRAFFAQHRVRNAERQTEWINAIRSATPLTRDSALVEPYAQRRRPGATARDLNASIAQFEEQLGQAVAQHPDDSLFRSVPGAGDALVPRLIAGFGSEAGSYEPAKRRDLTGSRPSSTKRQNPLALGCVIQRYHRSVLIGLRTAIRAGIGKTTDPLWVWRSV